MQPSIHHHLKEVDSVIMTIHVIEPEVTAVMAAQYSHVDLQHLQLQTHLLCNLQLQVRARRSADAGRAIR